MEGKGMNARKLIGAAVFAVVAGPPVAAVAQTDYVGTTPPEVEGIELTRADPLEVLGVQESRDPGGTLPVTGGDLAGLAFLGAGAVALGTLLVRRGRTASVTA
jgi:hypothetical protein